MSHSDERVAEFNPSTVLLFDLVQFEGSIVAKSPEEFNTNVLRRAVPAILVLQYCFEMYSRRS